MVQYIQQKTLTKRIKEMEAEVQEAHRHVDETWTNARERYGSPTVPYSRALEMSSSPSRSTEAADDEEIVATARRGSDRLLSALPQNLGDLGRVPVQHDPKGKKPMHTRTRAKMPALSLSSD